MAESSAGAWQKGEKLAQLVAERRTLLILDGLEPLQDVKTGALRDEALRSLLRGLAARNRGLCVVTTRQHLPDLDTWRPTAPEWELNRLSTAAGAELLHHLGVDGTPKECEQLARDVKGHALTLTLLGKYLAAAHGGDIRKRDRISLTEADHEETRGHAFSVMAAYERWFEETNDGRIELAILRLLGLFDRPATPDCIAALRRPPAIAGLTDLLVDASDARWNVAVNRLVALGLVEEQAWERRRVVGYTKEEAKQAKEHRKTLGEARELSADFGWPPYGVSLDSHPLVREFTGSRLREMAPEGWKEAHARLFEYLCASVPCWPDGLDGLQALYQAVAHGCHAGRYGESLDEVLVNRILRGTQGPHAFYSSWRLGAISANLAAVSCFFARPWSRPLTEISDDQKAWVQGIAGHWLRTLGRLGEARELMRAHAERTVAKESWDLAASAFGNLAELSLTQGDLAAAVREGERSVTYADADGDAFDRATTLATVAYILLASGDFDRARTHFEEAERISAESSSYPYLYSFRGFNYCDLLLREPTRAAWQVRLAGYTGDSEPLLQVCREVSARAASTLSWAKRNNAPLLTVGLDYLTLARTTLCEYFLQKNAVDMNEPRVSSLITSAVELLHKSGFTDEISRASLTHAEYHALHGNQDAARSVLAEAEDLASRGPMPLHRADICLTRARLFFRDDRTAARKDLRVARELIRKHGYLRRMEELEDAEKVIL